MNITSSQLSGSNVFKYNVSTFIMVSAWHHTRIVYAENHLSMSEIGEKEVSATGNLLKDTDTSNRRTLKTIEEKYADVTLRLVEQYGHTVAPLTAEGEKKLNLKLYLHLLSLLLIINLMLFVSNGLLFLAPGKKLI